MKNKNNTYTSTVWRNMQKRHTKQILNNWNEIAICVEKWARHLFVPCTHIFIHTYIYILKNLCLNSYKQIAGTCNRLSVKTSFHHSPPICHSAQKESEQQAQAKCWQRWGEHKLVYKTSRNSHPNSNWLSLRLSACLSAHSVKWHSWHSCPKERASDHGCSIVAGWA